MWAGEKPLGQFHSNNVASQPPRVAPSGQFNVHPLPPSGGVRNCDAGRRAAAVAVSVWPETDDDHAWTATVFMILKTIHSQTKQKTKTNKQRQTKLKLRHWMWAKLWSGAKRRSALLWDIPQDRLSIILFPLIHSYKGWQGKNGQQKGQKGESTSSVKTCRQFMTIIAKRMKRYRQFRLNKTRPFEVVASS